MDNHEELASHLFLSVEQSRNVDRYAIDHLGMSSLVLMENAGRGAATAIHNFLLNRIPITQTNPASQTNPVLQPNTVAVTLLIGSGNNGGDGWVIARHLEAWGFKPHCILFGPEERLSADNRANYSVLRRAGTEVLCLDGLSPNRVGKILANQLGQSSLIIDTLLGTGSTGAPREPMAEAIRIANQAHAWRVAIDLPSGLDADLGTPADPTFRAHLTVTMVTRKLGFKNRQAADYLGETEVVPIGIPASQLQRLLKS
jgi:NAD(P)H-hydrate epimerase